MYTIDGWGRALQYVSCAISIAIAVGTEAIIVAAIGCAGLIAQALDA
jgi:hypothetical protein